MKGRRVRLTDAGVGRLKPHTTEYAVWDSEVPGLGVRVRPSGHRSFVWHGRVQGEPVRATVGPAALMTVEDARKGALALRLGTAPHKAEGRSSVPLFRDFVLDEWLPAYRRRCAPSSCRSVNRVLERQLIPAFGRIPLDAIRRTDVERWFDAYSRTAPGGANKAHEILGQIMNAALAAGHAGTSPARGIAKNPRPKLTRFLSAEEIERLHRVLDRLAEERPSRRQQADVVRLLLLTGCRVGEILKLQWSEVDGDRLNLVDTKTGPRRVWLSQAAQAILARQPRAASPYVFPSPRHPDKPLSHTLCLWRRARKEAGLDDVRLHDLRHTVASQAVARGVPLSTVARMLGHADPTMTLRYAHVGDRDLQDAAERIGRAIEGAMNTGEPLARERDVAVSLDGVGLTEGQEEAVRTILLARDRIVGVQGRAGTGKTTMLRQVRELAGNRLVIGLAPSAAAADVLGRETGIHARTLQWFLARHRAAGSKGQALEALKETFGGSVLVLDEASMVSTDQMRSLLRAADRLDVARVVLVGDSSQLRAVEAGQPFRLLQRAGMTTAAMHDIQRQRTPKLRAAVQAVLAGDPGEAVELLGSSVHEVAHEELGEKAARTWLALDPATRDNTLLVAPTHALREEINRTVREALADEGVLRGKPLRIERLVSLGMTRTEKGDVRNYREGDLVVFNQDLKNYRLEKDEILTVTGIDHDRVMLLHPDGKPRGIHPAGSIRYRLDVYEPRPIEIRAGDRIRWTRNDRKRSLINGERAEVEGIAKGRVRFRLADGRGLSLRVDDPQLQHIDHAWSSTVHGAQGSTADGVIAVLDSSRGALTDQSTFYVEISRARDRAVVLTDDAEQLVKVLADNTGERPTAIEAVDAPIELEPEEIVRLLAEKEPVWTPREEWEALERRARREGTVLFLVDGYGELIGGTRELAGNPDLPAVTREDVDGLLAYDRACWEGDRAAVEFLGLLDAHDARRRGLDEAAESAECPVAGLEDYPDWREMSGCLSANGEVLLAALGERAGEAGGTISRRLGSIADLLAVDDAVLEFDTQHREVVARAAADGTIPFYAEGHDDLVGRARELARLSPLPAWALAAAREIVAHAETCEERKAKFAALHASAVGLLDERRKLEDRARTDRRSAFTPPTELEGYANWLARCGEVSERWCVTGEDPDTWQPHLDRLKDEAGKIAAAAERFHELGQHDVAWARVFEQRQTMAERAKAGNVIAFYLSGWEELVEEARALGRREGLPDQARNMAQRVLEYDRRRSTERATVVGFLEDAREHGQYWDVLEEDAKRHARQDPDFLVTGLPGYRSLPDFPEKLLTAGRTIHKDEGSYGPHLDRIPDGRETLTAALQRLNRHHLLDRFVSVKARIEETKPGALAQGISPVGDEGYDEAIARAERLAREPDLEEAARRWLQTRIDERAVLSAEWMTFQGLFREANEVDEQYRELEKRATRATLPLSLLAEWPAWQERNRRFEEDVRWALYDDDTRERWQVRPDMLERIEQGLRHSREREVIPGLEADRIADMVRAELARLRDPGASHAFTRPWVGQEPLLAGERITLRLSDDGPQLEAVVCRPGRTGGCALNDVVEFEWVAPATGSMPEEPVTRMSGLRLAGREVLRAEWSNERLREVERARQWPEPPASHPLDCSRDLTVGDRLWCIEVGASETAAWPHVRRPHARLPSVVQIELEVVQRTAEETEAEDRCTLRELWRSDDEPYREFSLSLGELAAFARARAFWDNEDERWSKARAQKAELDQRRTILLQPGPHHVMRP